MVCSTRNDFFQLIDIGHTHVNKKTPTHKINHTSHPTSIHSIFSSGFDSKSKLDQSSMGCIMSSDHDSSSSRNDNIRVVHFDGRIEDYDLPIKVNQIIQNPKKNVLCTKSQLLCPTSSKALNSDCELQLGNLYFLMPISAFKSEASVMDMANMVTKLTNIAKSTKLLKECSRPVSVAASVGGSGCGFRSGRKERCVWKPVLDTIGEKSLNDRSESDLHDY